MKKLSDMIFRISKTEIEVEGVSFIKTQKKCSACKSWLYECSYESEWYWCLKCNTNLVVPEDTKTFLTMED